MDDEPKFDLVTVGKRLKAELALPSSIPERMEQLLRQLASAEQKSARLNSRQ